MLRGLTVFTLLILLVAGGCTFTGQANNASPGLTVDPFAYGSGQVVSLANDRYYINGEPMDMRR